MHRTGPFRTRGRFPAALLTPLLAAAVLGGCADLDPTGTAPVDHAVDAVSAAASAAARAEPLTVLSRNLYLGADVAPILTATTPLEVALRAGEAWQQVEANDAPARAAAWAAEIAALRPHLVGLQEVATFWRQSPGDFLAGNPQPATDLQYDFLALLLAELETHGVAYTAAVAIDNMHLELPMLTATGGLDDVRMLIRDVILARADVAVANAASANFQAGLQLEVAGVPLFIPRGWASVDATIAGRSLHFVTTHLEAFHPLAQEAQAAELATILAGRAAPIVLVGDLNSRPDGSRTQSYAILRDAGFADAWIQANPGDPGFTCCQDADLSNETSLLDQRIDYVLVRDAFAQTQPSIVGSVHAWLVGAHPADRIDGLWPSDHAGVATTLRIPAATPLAP